MRLRASPPREEESSKEEPSPRDWLLDAESVDGKTDEAVEGEDDGAAESEVEGAEDGATDGVAGASCGTAGFAGASGKTSGGASVGWRRLALVETGVTGGGISGTKASSRATPSLRQIAPSKARHSPRHFPEIVSRSRALPCSDKPSMDL
jgi:hypothetical protein